MSLNAVAATLSSSHDDGDSAMPDVDPVADANNLVEDDTPPIPEDIHLHTRPLLGDDLADEEKDDDDDDDDKMDTDSEPQTIPSHGSPPLPVGSPHPQSEGEAQPADPRTQFVYKPLEQMGFDWQAMLKTVTASQQQRPSQESSTGPSRARASSTASLSRKTPEPQQKAEKDFFHYSHLRYDVLTTVDDTLGMLTGFLGDPMNISVVQDPFNEREQQAHDPLDADEPPSPGSPSAPPVVDAFGLNDPFPSSALSTLLLFSSLDPTVVLGLAYIKTGVVIIRSFLRVILSIPDSELSRKEKAALINGAVLVLFKDWCSGTLVSRILAGEALSLTDVEAHITAFWQTTEVGVVLSVISQVDIAYVSAKKRAEGWLNFFDRYRRRYYRKKVFVPLKADVLDWYQRLLFRCFQFAINTFQVHRWFPDLATYWDTGGDLLQFYVIILALTSGYLNFFTTDSTKHDTTAQFSHELISLHMPSVDIYSLIPKLREAHARHDTSSLQKMYALRSGPLLATTTHILALLTEASPIAMINFAEMRNPYIARSAPETTWHAPVIGFSAAVLTVCLGGVWKFGNEVNPLAILNNSESMTLLTRKALTTVAYMKHACSTPEKRDDILWVASYNSRRAIQLLAPASMGADKKLGNRALWATVDPTVGDIALLEVPDLADALAFLKPEVGVMYTELSRRAAQSRGEKPVDIPWPDSLADVYIAAFQLADTYLLDYLRDPVFEQLYELSRVTVDSFGPDVYSRVMKAMQEAAKQAAQDKARLALEDHLPAVSGVVAEELLPLFANTVA